MEDHARAIDLIFHQGKTADTYNIGGFNEWKNIDIIKVVIKTVDRLLGRKDGEDMDLITYVTDRKGHDMVSKRLSAGIWIIRHGWTT